MSPGRLGGFLHRRVLLEPAADLLRGAGFRVTPEFRLPDGRRIDLLGQRDEWLVAVEAELSPRRVRGDLEKARTVSATHLVVLLPTFALARRVRAGLPRGCAGANPPRVFVSVPGGLPSLLTGWEKGRGGGLEV